MELESDAQGDRYYYNMVDVVKSEPGVIDLVADELGDAQPEMQVLPQFACTMDNAQPTTSMAETKSTCETNALPVCLWDNTGDGQLVTSQSWTENGFQMPSMSDETCQPPDQQPEHTPSISNKAQMPQKSVRLWPMNKRSVKKWQRSGGQYAGMQLKCSYCPDTFIHKRSLSRHMMIVHGPKLVWWCRRCCRFYNRRDNLRTHYRNHHPKYIKDLDYIHGVRRECVPSEVLPQSTRPVGNPSVVTSGSTNPGSSIKIGQKSGMYQATQLKKKEQGVVGVRQDNMRIKTTPMQGESPTIADCSYSQSPAGVRCRLAQITTEVQPPTLPLPRVKVSQIRRPSSPKVASTSPAVPGLQRNPITTTDVLAYQLQRESSKGNDDIVEISGESSSDGEPESPQHPSQCPRDGNLVTVERGAPFKDLQIEKVMQGQVTKVTEEHQTFVYSGGEKRRAERRKRIYNVLYLDKVGEETEQTQTTASASSTLNDNQLAQRVKGQVTRIIETSSKYTYAKGEKVAKEKTKRVYDVMLLGGLTNI